jgi:hypothetical protein
MAKGNDAAVAEGSDSLAWPLLVFSKGHMCLELSYFCSGLAHGFLEWGPSISIPTLDSA